MSFTGLQESGSPDSFESKFHAFPIPSPPPPQLVSFPTTSRNNGSNIGLPIDLSLGNDNLLYSLEKKENESSSVGAFDL